MHLPERHSSNPPVILPVSSRDKRALSSEMIPVYNRSINLPAVSGGVIKRDSGNDPKQMSEALFRQRSGMSKQLRELKDN